MNVKTTFLISTLVGMLTALSEIPPGQAQEGSQDRRQRMQAVREKIAKTFADDPEAKIPTSDLPARMAEQIDSNEDGFITHSEYQKSVSESRRPRDRSDFTMLNDDGFPLNVDPEIVAASEAEIGDEDMVMGVVINGEPRAYPVNYMNGPQNEVVNDVLGGKAIASTW